MNIAQKQNLDIAAAQQNLDLAVVGNCRTAALVNPMARIVWWCFPALRRRPGVLPPAGGRRGEGIHRRPARRVRLHAFGIHAQHRDRHHRADATQSGNAVRITDFAPRFQNFGRTFRPPQLMRIIEPIAGLPRITIRFRPTYAHGRTDMQRAFGSNHIRYTGGNTTIRLTTDAPLSYIDREAPFVLSRPVSLVFGADTPFEGDLATTCREFAERTRDYWQEWLRRLAISYEWQDAVMRAAITLKLSSFEETGAIIAAQTTSVPEAPGSGRTWDYRFCWLRDAYFVVHAFNRIGASRTMEDYISYILTIVSGNKRRAAAGLQSSCRPIRWRSASSPT